MRKRKEQSGFIYRKSGCWYLRYYDDRAVDGKVERKRLAKQLGPVALMTKAHAQREAKMFLAAVNGIVMSPAKAIMLCEFVAAIYFPHVERRLRPSTMREYRGIWRQLAPFCDRMWIRDVRTCDMQNVLDALAADGRLNINSLKHSKAFLSGVFRLAIQQDYRRDGNPIEYTSLPNARKAGDTYAYSLEETDRMLAILPEPAATIVATAAYTGARRGEIRGMRWENFTGDEIRIAQSIWNSHVTEPKSAKSKAPIPIVQPLRHRLEFHRLRVGSPASGPMFPNNAGRPVDLNNVLGRVMLPIFRRENIEWHGWHAFRRGLATNLYRLGVPDKTIQSVLRHANVSTTTSCYIKTSPPDAREAMRKLEVSLLDTYRTPEEQLGKAPRSM